MYHAYALHVEGESKACIFLYSSCGPSGVQGDLNFLVLRIVLCSSCSGAAGGIHIEQPGAEQRLYTSVFSLREVSLVFFHVLGPRRTGSSQVSVDRWQAALAYLS